MPPTGLGHLSRLTKLHKLSLAYTQVTNAGMVAVKVMHDRRLGGQPRD
jgi:hypothetical protein